MRNLVMIAVVVSLASPVYAGFPGSSFFNSVMDKVSGKESGSSSSNDADGSGSASDSDSGSGGDSGNDSGDAGSGTWGKKSAKEYLDSLPPVPADGCPAEEETAQKFREQVSKVAKLLEKDIKMRQQQVDEVAEQHRGDGEKIAMKKAGYGDMDPAALKKKQSKKEKQAMADKILMERYGITQDQAKKLAKSSTENKAAFAQSVAAEKQAEDLSKPQDQLEAEKNDAKNEARVQKEFNAQQKKIAAFHQKYAQQLKENRTEKSIVRLEKEIEKAQQERNDLVNASSGELLALLQKIWDLKEQYCNTLAPKQLKVLRAYRSAIGDNMAQYQRLDELASELQKVHLGVGMPDAGKGLSALSAVKGFASDLKKAYESHLTPYPRPDDDGTTY